MAQPSDTKLTREAQTIRAIARFCLRMVILLIFSAFSSVRFDRILMLLLLMSTVLSAALAMLKRERPLASAINHWDEAIAYAALCCMIIASDYRALG